MKRELNKGINVIIMVISVIIGIVGILVLVLIAHMMRINNIGVRGASLQQSGKDLFVICSAGGYVGKENRSMSFTNSTEMLRDILPGMEDSIRCRILPKSGFSKGRLESIDNIWVFAKNIPEDADGAAIVVATRNIDPDLLRLNFSANEMDDPLILHSETSGILKHLTLAVRKDGHSCLFWNNGPHRYTFRDLFDTPFTVTNRAGHPVSYLFPTGEWIPRTITP